MKPTAGVTGGVRGEFGV